MTDIHPPLPPEADPRRGTLHLPDVRFVGDADAPAPPTRSDSSPQTAHRQAAAIGLAAAPFAIGPSGGTGGRSFATGIFPAEAELRRIRVWYGDMICGIAASYQAPGQRVGDLPRHGCAGPRQAELVLQPGEHVTALSGRYGRYVDSLEIHTSLGRRHRFGGSGGAAEFQYMTPPGLELCGFGGKCGERVDSIGPLFRRAPEQVDEDRNLPQGPCGGFAGRRFLDRAVPAEVRITGVRIQAGDRVHGIGLTCDGGGHPRDVGFHGSEWDAVTFPLEHGESIIGIAGFYEEVVRGVRIVTSRRISPTFGAEQGVPFVFKTTPLDAPHDAPYEVAGLLGYEDPGINALGVIYRRRTRLV